MSPELLKVKDEQ